MTENHGVFVPDSAPGHQQYLLNEMTPATRRKRSHRVASCGRERDVVRPPKQQNGPEEQLRVHIHQPMLQADEGTDEEPMTELTLEALRGRTRANTR